MWSPVGLYSWSQVLGLFSDVSSKTLKSVANGGIPRALNDGKPQFSPTELFALVDGGFADDYPEADFIIGLTTTFLLTNFIDSFPPVLANINGSQIDLDWPLLSHKDQLERCSYGWPIKASRPFLSLFEFQKAKKFSTKNLLERFTFIDPNTGRLKNKNGSKEFLINGLWLEPNHANSLCEFASKVPDYVLCWTTFPEPVEFRRFLECIEVNSTFSIALDHNYAPISETGNALQKRAHGRPRQRDELAEAYFSIFPKGHEAEGQSWKQATLAVQKLLGRKIVEDTLKRGVTELAQKRKNV